MGKIAIIPVFMLLTSYCSISQVAGDLRQISSVGYLEVYDGSQWVWVCDDIYQDVMNDIRVLDFVCKQLSGDISAKAYAASNNTGDSGLPLVTSNCETPIGGGYLRVLIFDTDCPPIVGNILNDCTNMAFAGGFGCSTQERVCIECLVNGRVETEFPFPPLDPIPTLSQWGLIILGLCLSIFGFVEVRSKIYNPV